MTRRYIEDLLTTSLKYFFDVDFHTLLHSFTVVIVALGVIRLIGLWIYAGWHKSLQTVKNDALEVKTSLIKMTSKLDKHEQAFTGYIRNLRSANEHEHERMAS